jgi:hypothetical protein
MKMQEDVLIANSNLLSFYDMDSFLETISDLQCWFLFNYLIQSND